MKNDSIQKQWDNAAEAWVDFVRTGKDYSRDEMNNPAMFEILGDIRGKRILDVGCGEGYNCRIMAKKGAKVTAIDFSEKLINFAIRQEEKERLKIDYYILNANNLHIFKNNTFDIVTCFMALQDIEDYQGAVKETHRVLKKHGLFIFVIPHPCFETRIMGGKIIGGWGYKKGAKDRSTDNALYYKVDRYFGAHKYVVLWEMKRLTKHFRTTSFHRTLTNYADALYNAGFLILRLREPTPIKRGLAKNPIYFEKTLRIPDSIIIEAVKW